MLSLGLRLPLSGSGCSPPASLPPVGHGPVRSQLALLWYSVSPLFCERAWQCPRLELFVGKFSLSLSLFSLAIAQSGLLSHVSSLRLPSGHSGPVLPLSSVARTSLFSPRLLVVDPSVWATSPLGVAIRYVICGFYLFIYLFIFPPGYVALGDSKTPHRLSGERVSWCLETSPLLQLPPWDGSPSLTLLSLFLSFIFCPTSFQRQWAAFLGAWCPLPAFRSCFVEFAKCSNDLLMNLWGRKWSSRLIPPPSWDRPPPRFF